jgi:YgiT-type zinc finger domain-containing protein
MNCNQCGNLMTESTTTFTVVKGNNVYIVEGVPCLECQVCENTSFTQDVAKRLEQYASGRAIPVKTKTAWVYDWKEPIIEASKTPPSTVNIQVISDIRGTKEKFFIPSNKKVVI